MAKTIFDHHCRTKDNDLFSLDRLRGKVLLIVNTASKCGFTPQFKELEALHKYLNKQGLEILGFPCNQFGKQDPDPIEKITELCELNYGVTFPIFDKIEVNGGDAEPLFQHLKNAAPGICGTTAIKWNFTKFLVDQTGLKIKRFAPIYPPRKLEKNILTMLQQ